MMAQCSRPEFPSVMPAADNAISDAGLLPEMDPAILIERAKARLERNHDLFRLDELDVLHDADSATLWTFMNPHDRPSFTLSLLSDFERWQAGIVDHFAGDEGALKFLVLGSRVPGVFCYGGDLALFAGYIRAGDREGLRAYGHRCVEILHRNAISLDMPFMTIGMVEGDALGGGFEALLSFDYIVAEKGTKFGLPEVMFGLFPGMGAHAFLKRQLGVAKANRLILSGESITAEQMFDLGLVHRLAEPGEARAEVKKLIHSESKRHNGLLGARAAMRRVAQVPLDEMRDIVDIWADTALKLQERDLKLMGRLVNAQVKVAAAADMGAEADVVPLIPPATGSAAG